MCKMKNTICTCLKRSSGFQFRGSSPWERRSSILIGTGAFPPQGQRSWPAPWTSDPSAGREAGSRNSGCPSDHSWAVTQAEWQQTSSRASISQHHGLSLTDKLLLKLIPSPKHKSSLLFLLLFLWHYLPLFWLNVHFLCSLLLTKVVLYVHLYLISPV